MAAVQQSIAAFDRGDGEAMAAAFAVPGSILDGMAPHVWHGPTATQDWYRDVLHEGEQRGASGYFVTIGDPLHEDVTGRSAYVVVPATMTFKVHGQRVWALAAGGQLQIDIERVPLADVESAWRRNDLAGRRLVILP
jgi:hypothetical protein